MLIVALTGNIGSGKTTVAELFAELGAPIVDTDQLAREVVAPESEALQKIAEHFGEAILLKDGSLNRKKLREKIFESHEARTWLENLLHPRIRERAKRILQKLNAPYAIYVVPLLVGRTREPGFIDRILWVDAPEALQKKRVMARDQIDEASFMQILATQASREALQKAADDVIVNDHHREHLKAQVIALDRVYRGEQSIK